MEKGQMNLYLDTVLIARVKHAAIDEEKRLSDFVADVLEEYLDETRTEDKDDK